MHYKIYHSISVKRSTKSNNKRSKILEIRNADLGNVIISILRNNVCLNFKDELASSSHWAAEFDSVFTLDQKFEVHCLPVEVHFIIQCQDSVTVGQFGRKNRSYRSFVYHSFVCLFVSLFVRSAAFQRQSGKVCDIFIPVCYGMITVSGRETCIGSADSAQLQTQQRGDETRLIMTDRHQGHSALLYRPAFTKAGAFGNSGQLFFVLFCFVLFCSCIGCTANT